MSEWKLYVVGEDDLGCLHDYLVAAINGDDISELPRLWNQELGVIRSRPLSEEIRKARGDVLEQISTVDLIDALASRTKLGRIDLSRSQDAAILYGRKGSQTKRIEQISGSGCILYVLTPERLDAP